jgi:glycogen operon protein
MEFWRQAIALTRRYPVLQRRKFVLGSDLNADGIPDLSWFGADGSTPRWNDPASRTLCMLFDGGDDPSGSGNYLLYLVLNAHWVPQWVRLPTISNRRWLRVIDTSLPAGEDLVPPGHEVAIEPADYYIANARSTVLLVAR